MLDWDGRETPAGRKRLTLVRELLRTRKQQIVPRLVGATFGKAQVADDDLLTADWRMGDGATLRLLANLSDRAISHALSETKGTLIWGSELGGSVPPWTVLWRIG